MLPGTFAGSGSIVGVPRRGTHLRLVVVVSVASCALAACSASGGTATGAGSGPAPLATNAQTACDRYFAWDLYRSTRIPGAERATRQGRRAALRDFAELAARTASAVDSAVIVGDLPKQSQTAANRIAHILSRLVRGGGDISGVSGPVDTQISRPAKKLEAQCAAAGIELPEANRDVRE